MESRDRILHQLDATLDRKKRCIHLQTKKKTQDKELTKELLEKCLQDSSSWCHVVGGFGAVTRHEIF